MQFVSHQGLRQQPTQSIGLAWLDVIRIDVQREQGALGPFAHRVATLNHLVNPLLNKIGDTVQKHGNKRFPCFGDTHVVL